MDKKLVELVDLMSINGVIKSGSIKNAFLSVPRKNFFPPESKKFAFEDSAFPIGYGATISQPSTIAAMLEMLYLKRGQRVLEVGSGSGYVLALLNKITENKVFGIEIIPELVERSRNILKELKVDADVVEGDGKNGLSKKAPFDRIIVSARVDEVPIELFNELSLGGKLVAPIGKTIQAITLFDKKRLVIEEKEGYVFVPLK